MPLDTNRVYPDFFLYEEPQRALPNHYMNYMSKIALDGCIKLIESNRVWSGEGLRSKEPNALVQARRQRSRLESRLSHDHTEYFRYPEAGLIPTSAELEWGIAFDQADGTKYTVCDSEANAIFTLVQLKNLNLERSMPNLRKVCRVAAKEAGPWMDA